MFLLVLSDVSEVCKGALPTAAGTSSHTFSPPTIVEVAEVAGVEEEMCSEKVSDAAFAWSKGQGGVEVQATCPVCLATKIVT